jgi:hypothetical protein
MSGRCPLPDWESPSRAAPIGQFAALPGLKLEPPERWSSYTVSDPNGVGPTTDRALELLPDWAEGIERAAVLYARWSKEPSGQKRS